MPALIEAWRAGFWPCAAVRIWPMMTSETWPGSTPARSSAALMAMAPRSWAGVVANAPLKLPTGVRAALTMTTSSDMDISLWGFLGLRLLDGGRPGWRACLSPYVVNLVDPCQSAGAQIPAAAHSNCSPEGFH